ncbi:AP-4 complex accessory subunit RUSC1 [Heteronotia binoei]|uniref:AP-4 complex accessory subunit RUSC1 n=1 Tax=Heteronotia binoei TaxID=13085 RepID=UPI00292E46D1|nr:AP-4 complex accessory subunit RUSC1 [Heteronotia binoei]
MQSPKKGLICNLNHVHLQHISLGLHLSRHPELQEDSNALTARQQMTDCQECRHGQRDGSPELVDANSNNPSTPCRCCDSHPLRSDIKLGLQIQPVLPNRPTAKNEGEEEEEEEVRTPSDAASSSVSSCSDLSLDDTPVSVYYKEFPTEEAPSPDQQPNIVPLEDSHSAVPPADCDDQGPNLNIRLGEHPVSHVQDSPDSLGSSSSLGSPSASPCTESPVESPPTVACAVPSIAPPPIRPCRAPPAVPAAYVGTELDSNCNALPAQPTKSENLSALPSGQPDVILNRATPPRPSCPRGPPPPIPPRTKRGLLGLKRYEVGKPTVAPSSLPESQSGYGDEQSENGKKNVTSFHELAQKRKKVTAVPPFPQTRKDQSDWLIVFSPDTELPPCNELTCGSAQSQETTGPPTSPNESANPAGCGQREVTTFKELRYRKQKTQPAPKGGAPPLQLVNPAKGIPDGNSSQEVDWQLPPNGHYWAPKETQPRRKKSRPGLQPIAERGCEEDEGMEQQAPHRSFEDMAHRRDSLMPGKAERDRGQAEAGTLPACSSCPQNLPFQPLLFHFSLVDGKAGEPLHPSLCPSLESVELTSPSPSGSPFCPRLKTLSCEEVCLLASSEQGQVFGTLSPEELLPIRLSPIGAYSPPARSTLPFLESPDLAVLFSPLFPRSRTFPALAFPTRQVPKLPFGACGPLNSQAGAGPGRVSQDSMGATNPGHPTQLRHSQSFGGVPSKGCTWGADANQVSVQLREQKKALLVALSASVDRIVAHFSTARNLVQKAQLGDSRLSPEVGYLVVSTLCPALRALVCDGLKPFQKDVITGQRPSSPWSVVEASAKPGPHTRSLNALYWRVSRLAPLRSNQQRFHAFILGLLNMKQLEQWFSHLQQNTDLISALYLPSAFLVLTQGFCRRWAEETLLLLQPLSTLTFQLDLLFEYHHLSLDVRPTSQQAGMPTELSAASQKVHRSGRPHLARHLGTVPSLTEGPLAQSSPLHEPQAGVSLPQRLLQWGDLLTHTLRGSEASPKLESCPPSNSPGAEEKQRNWWGRLNPVSGVHADSSASNQEGSPFTRWTKLRMALEEAVKEVCVGAGGAAPEAASPGESGAEMPTKTPTPETESSPEVAAEWKLEMSRSGAGSQEANEKTDTAETHGKGQRLRWLFGATSPAVSGSPPESDSSVPKSSRRPSSWLPPSINVLALVMKSAPLEKSWVEESWEEGQPDPLQPYRAVRALCNHIGTGADQLSFRKGDILQVLDTVNEDWLQCCRGDSRGLVPVSYTSLIL